MSFLSPIDYVGEWHTHPMGGGSLSTQDKTAVAGLRRHLDKAGMPTFVMVVTPKKLHPYVFAG